MAVNGETILAVLIPQTPKGVEHTFGTLLAWLISPVLIPQTPKGVEH